MGGEGWGGGGGKEGGGCLHKGGVLLEDYVVVNLKHFMTNLLKKKRYSEWLEVVECSTITTYKDQ